MDIKEIKAIYRFIKDTDIVELDIEGEKGKLRLKRGGMAASVPAAQAHVSATVEASRESRKEEAPAKKPDNFKIIPSPMVGTFYRAASPEAPAFVEMGAIVKKGQAMCIIEAMKLMNEVDSDFDGRVVAILVENGQPVEYGEPLFHIETSK